MTLNDLATKDSLSQQGVYENSYAIINYAENNEDTPITYKVTLNTLGGKIASTLNMTDNENRSAYYIQKITETNGIISPTYNSLNPSVSFPTVNNKPGISVTVGGNTSTGVSLPIASTNAYGITSLSSSTNSNAEDVAATPKAIKDAIEALDITTITNTTGKTLTSLSETDGKVSAAFTDIQITESQVTDLTTHLNNKLEISLKGANSGLATLDENGKVPAAQLPSYVDDVLEYANTTVFPQTGETGKIYVALDTNLTYRWSGSTYTEISQSLALGETSSTAYAGNTGKEAHDWASRAYTHAGASPQYTAAASGLYRVTVNNEGHVTATDTIQASDITSLLGTAAVKDVATSGDAATTEIVMGNDSRLTNARNAADVSAWAKESTKPTYTANEVGAIPMPTLPIEDGTYTLQVVISDNTPTYSWISQA